MPFFTHASRQVAPYATAFLGAELLVEALEAAEELTQPENESWP